MEFQMCTDRWPLPYMIFSIVVCSIQIILAAIGIFGHSFILLATYRTKKIQTKYVNGVMMNEMTCFMIFAIFSAVTFWQSLIMLAISADLLSAIVFPVLYRKWMVGVNVPMNILLCALISLIHTIIIWRFGVDVMKYGECNAFIIGIEVLSITSILNYCISSSQVLIYFICYIIVYIRARIFMHQNKNACYRNQHRATMRTISVLITVYACTWVLAMILVNLSDLITDKLRTRWIWMIAFLDYSRIKPQRKKRMNSTCQRDCDNANVEECK
ncbi:hypothetical protein DICVIV_03872 [Dictyocaulus viviparus]|uniref:G-protein coupled receptors family 1 profile domain-containing protein n=1 Tax=Dictyocaulus viviparus TaxID=29172 RepID=A0A0D8Y1S6_DICVI|nr:hypothetical protein DICVIV_03872 [Dictyocaulus viviparus]